MRDLDEELPMGSEGRPGNEILSSWILSRFIHALQKITYSSNLKINPSTGKVGLEGSPVSDDQLFRF